MTPNTKPTLPPALRKARKPEEISNAFPPIVPRPRPEPPPPAPAPAPAPVVAAEPAPTQSAPAAPAAPPAPPKPSRPTPPAPLPPIVTAPAAPKTRPKPVFTGRPAVAALEGKVVIFEGTFRFEGTESFTTETKLTGNPKNDRQSLIALARQKHPTGHMELRSTRIFTRESASATTFAPGTTISQLFGDPGTATEVSVEVGTVFFDGARCQIFIRNLRTRNAVTISLRQPTGGNINFSNHIQPNRLVKELHSIVKEVLGTNTRELVITLKESK